VVDEDFTKTSILIQSLNYLSLCQHWHKLRFAKAFVKKAGTFFVFCVLEKDFSSSDIHKEQNLLDQVEKKSI
jgi:hypothetical protein